MGFSVFNYAALHWLYIGETDKVLVAELSSTTISLLNVRTAEVHMNAKALKHIIDENRREITIADVLLLPKMISDGLLIRETARNDSFVISYQAAKYRLKAAFVIAAGGHEIWVSTLHRMRLRQIRALLKRGTIIRRHR